jgi:plastocyanin
MIARTVGVAVLAAAAASVPATGSGLRRHRLLLPTPPLPNSLTVDEREWAVVPSERVVAAGSVTFTVYDRGQDAHNLTIQGPETPTGGAGQIRGQVWMKSGGMATIVTKLPAGTYTLYCSMFAGTPQSHEMLGMRAQITAS